MYEKFSALVSHACMHACDPYLITVFSQSGPVCPSANGPSGLFLSVDQVGGTVTRNGRLQQLPTSGTGKGHGAPYLVKGVGY